MNMLHFLRQFESEKELWFKQILSLFHTFKFPDFYLQSCNNILLLKQWYFLLDILNYLRGYTGVIHLWRPQKMIIFVTLHPPLPAKVNDRPTRISTSVTNFKTLPPLFCMAVINMMVTMMTCFCGMFDRLKAFNLISSRKHCQKSSSSRIFHTPQDMVPR